MMARYVVSAEVLSKREKAVVDEVTFKRRQELQAEHADWSDKTFGEPDLAGLTKHLVKETRELELDPEDDGELADCIMLLWSIARARGLDEDDLNQLVHEKLQVHKARKWSKPVFGQPTHHIKENE